MAAQHSATGALTSDPAPADGGACPAGMLLVDTDFCTEIARNCVKDEYTASNRITICHRFAEGPGRCVGERRRVRTCIDRYERPNRAGARAPVHIDAWDALALCAAEGKRLCYESEWTAACEGPEKTPFPTGYERDPSACNIDNPWLKPSLQKADSPDPAVHQAERTRLDQGVASGARPRCVSGFGVHDLPGNVDEWVLTDRVRGKGKQFALKGGAWGHVRNACRPVTTSHAPEWSYYFTSTRCCADPDPAKLPPANDASLEALPPMRHPPVPAQKKPASRLSPGWTPTGPGGGRSP